MNNISVARELVRISRELVSERAKSSDLLKMVSDGSSSEVEGEKVKKETAKLLLKIYNLMDSSSQKMFDKSSMKTLLRAYGDLVL